MRWGWDYNREDDFIERSICISDDSGIDMNKAIRLSVLPAKGGCVLETRAFDKKTHDWITEAHIIPEGEDVAHRIGQIVALELLKR
jgi:hypothetical protein